MPTYARGQIVVEDEVGVYHCIARCVRRAFLCGVDPYTGKDYSHRKEWILDRVRELAGLFAIEVCGYCVMSNHLHLVLRNRPDIHWAFTPRAWVGSRAQLTARRRVDRTDRSTGHVQRSPTTVVSMGTVSDCLKAPRPHALVDRSGRRIYGCLNSLGV
jgi:REP element-mobilizing transposase RayT